MDYQYQKGDETPGKVWLVSVIVGREIHRDAALELSELATSCGFQVAGLTEAKRDRPEAAKSKKSKMKRLPLGQKR